MDFSTQCYYLKSIFITLPKVSQNSLTAIIFFMDKENEKNSAEKQKETIPQLFGRNVKAYRKKAGLTQEQLSERLGVSQKHLSIIETGAQFASASLIGRISEVLNVSPGDLFGGSSSDMKREIEKTRSVILSTIMNSMTHSFAGLSMEIAELKRICQTGRNSGLDSGMDW